MRAFSLGLHVVETQARQNEFDGRLGLGGTQRKGQEEFERVFERVALIDDRIGGLVDHAHGQRRLRLFAVRFAQPSRDGFPDADFQFVGGRQIGFPLQLIPIDDVARVEKEGGCFWEHGNWLAGRRLHYGRRCRLIFDYLILTF